MNQNIKSFEEFKELYTSEEFKEVLKKANKYKKMRRKEIVVGLIYCMLVGPFWLLSIAGGFILFIVMCLIFLLGFILVERIFIGKKGAPSYSNFYNTEIPFLIARLSGIELNIAEISNKKFYKERYGTEDYEKIEARSFAEQFKNLKGDFKKQNEFIKKQKARIAEINELNKEQFKNSKIVDADAYYTSNIAQFKHKNTDTTINFYYAKGIEVKIIEHTRLKSDADDYTGDDRYETYEERRTKILTSGVVFTFDNLYNIKLKNCRILIKDDDTLLSHLTENTIDSIKKNENEIKFNRIDLNKSFDFFVYGNNEDAKVDALQIVTPTVEDLLAYIRKKYGRFNMAINDQKIDIELLDTRLVGGNKKQYKSIILKPKVFSNKDLKISYLYRFYELIEIQKIILKYLSCYPEKYLITEDDVIGLKEAVESKEMSNYEMDKSVEETFKEIILGGV